MDDDGSGLYHRAYDLQEGETQAFYAEWAATYDEELIGEKGYALPDRCRRAFEQHVPDRATEIIDLGCGTGLLGQRLAEAGYRSIDGVDYSPEMLEVARRTGVYRHLSEADLNRRLEVPDATYGAGAATGVFSFAHVEASALDEMLRILRPGGRLVIGVNEYFVDEGSLDERIHTLETSGRVMVLERTFGDHVKASGVNGWIIVLEHLGPD